MRSAIAMTVRSGDDPPGRHRKPGKGQAEVRQDAFDVVIVGIESEDLRGLGVAFLPDNGFEQLFLVLEIDVERAFRHPGHPGDLTHAGGVKASRHEDLPGALDDLAPLGAILIAAAEYHPLDLRAHFPILSRFMPCITEGAAMTKIY